MQLKTRNGIRLSGFYRGQVLQHLSGGKCKVFVPGVYPDRCANDPDSLPDAEQAAPLFGGTNRGNGMFSYPNINTIVWVFFENEDQNRPVYFAATLGGELAVDSIDEGFMKIRDNVSPDDDPQKDTMKNGEDSQQHMINCGHSRILLRESGQIEIECVNKKEKTQTKIFIDESGSLQIQTSQSVQLNTPALKIDAQDQLEINTTTFIIRANNAIHVNAPQFTSVNSNMFMAKSPSINMDATQGMFIAKGKRHAPLTVA